MDVVSGRGFAHLERIADDLQGAGVAVARPCVHEVPCSILRVRRGSRPNRRRHRCPGRWPTGDHRPAPCRSRHRTILPWRAQRSGLDEAGVVHHQPAAAGRPRVAGHQQGLSAVSPDRARGRVLGVGEQALVFALRLSGPLPSRREGALRARRSRRWSGCSTRPMAQQHDVPPELEVMRPGCDHVVLPAGASKLKTPLVLLKNGGIGMRRGDQAAHVDPRGVVENDAVRVDQENLADGVDRARDVGGARLVTLFSVIWLGSIWLNVTDSLAVTSKVFQLMTALDVVWLMTVFWAGRRRCRIVLPDEGAAVRDRAVGGRGQAWRQGAQSGGRDGGQHRAGAGDAGFPRRRAHSLATVQHALLAFHITYESCSWDSFWGWMTCRILRGTVLLHSGAAGQK